VLLRGNHFSQLQFTRTMDGNVVLFANELSEMIRED
jgi:hypothetical protein